MRRQQQVTALCIAIAAGSFAILAGCEPKNVDRRVETPMPVLQPLPVVAPASSTLALWELQQQQIERALTQAEQLNRSIAELLHAPTAEQLAITRAAWQQAVEAFEPLVTIERLARKQPHLTWQALANQFTQIAAWPSRLGYLDDNGIHGATGLIFDLDTPISAKEVRHQHQLTGDYDLTTGLYPIGQILMGYGASRDAEVFHVVATLNDALRVKGFEHVQEVPSNRRRQLIELQSTLLLEDIRLLSSLWQGRQSNSPLNAFSQLPLETQKEQLYNAAIDVVAGQLSELHEQADLPVWQATEETANAQALRITRWQAQLAGADQWLTALGENVDALQALQAKLTTIHETSVAAESTSPESKSSEVADVQPEDPAEPNLDEIAITEEVDLTQQSIEASFAEAILALKPSNLSAGPASNEETAQSQTLNSTGSESGAQ